MTDLIISTLTQGLIYGLVAFGVYITYTILDFPDLSVDGTFPLGAAIGAVLLVRGVDPWLALAAAAAAGTLAGLVTGVIHVVFRVRNLLAGIITQTALFSINLLIAGASNVPIGREADTIFSAGPAALLGGMSLGLRRLIVSAILVLAVMILPYIINVSETALRAVPREYEEASLALGATETETYFKVSLHAARSGVATAVVQGVGRAIGEAMAIIMVSGNVANMPGLFKSVRFLTTAIVSEMSYAAYGSLQRQALFSIGLVLFLFIMLINAFLTLVIKKERA